MTNLKEIRAKLGLNQTQMAERLGVSQSFYSRLETGASPIDKRTMIAAAALGASATRRIAVIESITSGDLPAPSVKGQ